MTPRLLGLRHVALLVVELEDAVAFWTGVMGFRVEWQPDPDNAYLTSGSDNLALHRVADLPAGQGALDHIGIAVPSPGDVDAWAAHLAASGHPPRSGPKDHRDGSRSLYVLAPGGVTLQIIHHAPLR